MQYKLIIYVDNHEARAEDIENKNRYHLGENGHAEKFEKLKQAYKYL